MIGKQEVVYRAYVLVEPDVGNFPFPKIKNAMLPNPTNALPTYPRTWSQKRLSSDILSPIVFVK